MEENEYLPAGFEEMFEIPELREKFNIFEDEMYGDLEVPEPIYLENNMIEAPEGYTFIYVNAFGRGFAMIIPEGSLDKISGSQYVSVSKVECNCKSSTGSDCDRPMQTGSFISCSAMDCKKCQLTTSTEAERSVDIEYFRL